LSDLEERLRHGDPFSSGIELSMGREAANEIARLKAENADCREHETMANEKALQLLARNDEVESTLARSQALIDDMMTGLEIGLEHVIDAANESSPGVERENCMRDLRRLEAIIAKARDSDTHRMAETPQEVRGEA
jgi:hypothetical protein